MRLLRTFGLATIIALAWCVTAPAEEREAPAEDLSGLLANLTEVADMSTDCEAAMHQLAREALDTGVCRRFTGRFSALWGDRETLQEDILTFARRAENGDMPCDQRCLGMLQRSEELRISITYVLDYVDFVRQL